MFKYTLQIELGRQKNIDIHNRLCIYCLLNDNLVVIECEYHAFFSYVESILI